MMKKIMLYVSLALVAFVVVVCTHEAEMPVTHDNASQLTATTTPFHTQVGEPIPLATAEKWIDNYLNKQAGARDVIHSHFFGKETFERLLRQPGAVGISIHYAMNDAGVPQILLVAVDEKGVKMTGKSQNGYEDASMPCPPCKLDTQE